MCIRDRIRVIRNIIRVMRLIRWIRRYLVTSKEGMILGIRGSGRMSIRIIILRGIRVGVRYSMK